MLPEITRSTNQPLALMKLFYKCFFLFLRILQNIAKIRCFLCEFIFLDKRWFCKREMCVIFSHLILSVYTYVSYLITLYFFINKEKLLLIFTCTVLWTGGPYKNIKQISSARLSFHFAVVKMTEIWPKRRTPHSNQSSTCILLFVLYFDNRLQILSNFRFFNPPLHGWIADTA